MTGRKSILSALAMLLALAPLQPTRAVGQEPFRSLCGAGVHVDTRSGWVWLPQGSIFCPLAADPKGQRSFVTYLRGDFGAIASPTAGADTDVAAVGLSDSFSIFRFAAAGEGDGVQLDLVGAVFSQFNLDERSFDMINADYLVGLPFTFRAGSFSGRLRVYHQSSHLGDEFVLNRDPERVNLSFESLELLLSHEIGPLRVYGGGETFFSREPADLPARLGHGGLEIRPVIGDGAALMAALDLKVVDDEDWEPAWSARVGLEIARIPHEGHPPRILSLVGEFYEGVAPYGQFYLEDIRYFGVGFSLTR